jgi:hypothetical protein
MQEVGVALTAAPVLRPFGVTTDFQPSRVGRAGQRQARNAGKRLRSFLMYCRGAAIFTCFLHVQTCLLLFAAKILIQHALCAHAKSSLAHLLLLDYW